MATVLLLHHVLGLTPGVLELAERLRAGGHEVHAPDLYGGHVFAAMEDGFAHRRTVDVDAIADAAAAELPERIVYAGISLGVMPAQRLAQTRPGALGALLLEACLPIEGEDAVGPWPAGVPAQIHGMDADEFFVGDGDVLAARAIVESVPGSELFLYPGDGHLFEDSSLPGYDAAATSLLIDRALAFLGRLDS